MDFKTLIMPRSLQCEVEERTDSFARFSAEPFERGFATTIGNSMRRILLSSIQGTAITALRIDGVTHEYESLPGCKEDISDIILNLKQVPIEKRHKVIVVGDGRLGLLAVQVLALQSDPGQVSLLGKHEHKLMFCEKRGIRGILLEDMLMKPEWDVVVDCTGSTDGFSTACRLVRPRGKLVLKSTWVATEPIDLSPLVINEVTLIGSRCGPFSEAIHTLAAEQVIVNGLITSRFDLTDGVKALEKAKQPDQIKVILCNK